MQLANPFTPPFSFARLVASVAQDFDITPDQVLSRDNTRAPVQARAIVTHFCLERGWSHNQLGQKFGRDHSTIVHARKRFKTYTKWYPAARDSYARHARLRDEASSEPAIPYALREAQFGGQKIGETHAL